MRSNDLHTCRTCSTVISTHTSNRHTDSFTPIFNSFPLFLFESYTQQIGSNPVIAQVRRKKTLFLSVVQKMQNLSKKYQIPKSTYRKIRNRMLLLCNQEFPFFFCQNKNHFTTFLRSK